MRAGALDAAGNAAGGGSTRCAGRLRATLAEGGGEECDDGFLARYTRINASTRSASAPSSAGRRARSSDVTR